MEYLIHYNEETKFKYSRDEVHGELKSKLIKTIKNDGRDENENEKNIDLIEIIENRTSRISLIEFSKEVTKLGMWSEYRRSAIFYVKMIEEHNKKYNYK